MTTSRAPKVSVFTTMPPGIYSGGRYLSMMLAYAMARAGADVTYVTNNPPLFERDFAPFDDISPVRRIISPDFSLPDDLTSEWVVVIPTGGFDSRFYNAALQHAQTSAARIVLLSFETPNWYNALSPYPRSPMPTESWRQVVAAGGLVVTIAAEGLEPAQAYFGTERSDLAFGHWHPAINDLAAERARATLAAAGQGGADDRRRVTMFARTEDPHKGAQDLLALPPDLFDGHVLALVSGRGLPEAYTEALRRHFAPARDFVIEVHSQITDEEKFRLLGRSRLLLFPSYFEGFGYPPVEAAVMGVPTVAYDLPLLREVAGDAITAVPVGDTAALAAAVREALCDPARVPGATVRGMLRFDPGTLASGRRMLALFEGAAHLPIAGPPPSATSVPKNPRIDHNVVRMHQSRAQGSPRLLSIESRVNNGRLQIRGRIHPAQPDRLVRFRMDGARVPDALTGPVLRDGSASFAADGVIDRWIPDPDLSASGVGPARLDVAIAGSGKTQHQLGFDIVAPDWAALLRWPDEYARGVDNAPIPPVLVALEPSLLVSDPSSATLLGGLCDALDRQGRRVTLLVPSDAALPQAFAWLDVDLLPRGHDVETLDSTALQTRLSASVAAGRPVIVGPGMDGPVQAGRAPLRLSAGPDAPDETGIQIFLPQTGPDRGRTARFLRPDPRQGRRSLADQSRQGVIVLTSPVPPDGKCTELLRLLRRVALKVSGLRVVMLERLTGPDPLPGFGLDGRIEPLSESDLALLVTAGTPVVGLSIGGTDPVTLELLRDTGREVLVLDDGVPLMQSVVAALAAATPNGLTALVADLFETVPTPLFHTSRPHGARPAQSRSRSPLPAYARLDQVGFLSFSNTLGALSATLLHGWKDCNLYGARMGDLVANLVFSLNQPPQTGTGIEVMLRVTGNTKPGPRLRVTLNGMTLPMPPSLPLGISVHKLDVPPQAWPTPAEPGVLTLEIESDAEKHEITLIALALRSPGAPAPDWAKSDTTPAKSRAALILHTAEIEAETPCRFGAGHRPGAVITLGGWSAAEKDLIWSDGPVAILGLRRPPVIAAGLFTMTLAGVPMTTSARPHQRLAIEAGGCRRLLARQYGSGRIGLALSAAALSDLFPDHLVLHLPDATSPHEAGIGHDTRRLGFALREAQISHLPDRLAEGILYADGVGPVRMTLTCPPSVGSMALRLSGPDPVPAGGFTIAGTSAIHLPATVAEGGWDVSIPIEGLAGGRIVLGWIAPQGQTLPTRITVEAWGRTLPGAEAEPIEIVLDSLSADSEPDGSLPIDGPSASAAAHLDRWSAPVLALPVRLDATRDAEDPEARMAFLAAGWSSITGPAGTWTDGTSATLFLPGQTGPACVLIEGMPFLGGTLTRQRLSLSDETGARIAADLDERAAHVLPVVLPDGPVCRLTLDLPDAASPLDLGLSEDARKLGLLLSAVSVLPITPAEPLSEASRIDSAEITATGLSQIVGRAECVLWLAGTGTPPVALSLAGNPVRVCPARSRTGWRVGLVLAAAPRAGDVFPLALHADDGPEPAAVVELSFPPTATTETEA